MSRVAESGDEQASEAIDGRTTGIQHDYLQGFNSRSLTTLWDTALRQVYRLLKVFEECTVQALHNQLCFGGSRYV